MSPILDLIPDPASLHKDDEYLIEREILHDAINMLSEDEQDIVRRRMFALQIMAVIRGHQLQPVLVGQLDQALGEASPFVLAAEPHGPDRDGEGERSYLLEIDGSVSGGAGLCALSLAKSGRPDGSMICKCR